MPSQHHDGSSVTVDVDALDLERALNSEQVAEILGVTAQTIYSMRKRGEGPRFFRLSRKVVRYRLGDVLDWRASRTVGKRVAP